MSFLGGLLENIGNMSGPHKALLKFDAGTIRGASMVGQKVFGDNAIGHMFDWGRSEGEQNLANPGRQFRKGAEFYGKALLGGFIGDYFGGAMGGASGASETDAALASWGKEGSGAYAGSGSWEAGGTAAGAGAGMSGDSTAAGYDPGYDPAYDASAMYPGDAGLGSAGESGVVSPSGGSSPSMLDQSSDWLKRRFGGMSGKQMWRGGMGLYGLMRARQARRAARPPSQEEMNNSPEYKAALDAVTRQQLAGGYMGSGNMQAAVAAVGPQIYNQLYQRKLQTADAQYGTTTGELGSLGMLASAFGG